MVKKIFGRANPKAGRLLSAVAIIVSPCLFLYAQHAQPEQKSSTPDDMLALRTEISNLEAQQRQIIGQLDQVKQLLAATGRPRGTTPAPAVPPAYLDIRDEPFRGANKANVAIVEYADFECPFCGGYEQKTYPQIYETYVKTGKVKLIFRDLPLPIHPHSMIAARAARCAGEQDKFWEMHDSLFAKQNLLRDVDMPGHALEIGLDTAKFSDCFSSDRYIDQIKQSVAEAQKMGIGGTPTFFIGKVDSSGNVTNLQMIIGARPYDAFKSAIEAALVAAPNGGE